MERQSFNFVTNILDKEELIREVREVREILVGLEDQLVVFFSLDTGQVLLIMIRWVSC